MIKLYIRRVKKLLISIISEIDFNIALLFSSFNKSKSKQRCALVMPAGSINGGFGEDIMVAALLQTIECPVTIIAPVIEGRRYYNRETLFVEYGKSKFLCLKIAKIFRHFTDYYVIGADIMDGLYDDNNLRFKTLTIAKKMRVRPHITGFSVREQTPDTFKKALKKIAPTVTIMGRDVESCKRMSLILNKSVVETTDIAFLCDTPSLVDDDTQIKEWIFNERKQGRTISAFCPNAIQAASIGLSTYLNFVKELIDEFMSNNISVLFLYHDLRKQCGELNDKDLSNMLSQEFNGHKLFVDNIPDGYTLKPFIGLADFTITGRMHFGISGYTLGLPMYGISYYGKFEGLQSLFGIDPKLSLVDYKSNKVDKHQIKDFLNMIPIYRTSINLKISTVKEKALLNLK